MKALPTMADAVLMMLAEDIKAGKKVKRDYGRQDPRAFEKGLISAEKLVIDRSVIDYLDHTDWPTDELWKAGARMPFPITWAEFRFGHNLFGFLALEINDAKNEWVSTRVIHWYKSDDNLRMFRASIDVFDDAAGHVFVSPFWETSDEKAIKQMSNAAKIPVSSLVLSIGLLNLYKKVVSQSVPSTGSHMVKGRIRKYFSHRLVTINLSDLTTRVSRAGETGIKHRAHTVRGFYRVDPKTGIRSVWVKSHVRGDASLGWVYHSYNVEKEPPK